MFLGTGFAAKKIIFACLAVITCTEDHKDENDTCNICKRTFKNGRTRRIHESRSHKDQDANTAVEKGFTSCEDKVAKLAKLEILESRLTFRQQAYAITSIKK